MLRRKANKRSNVTREMCGGNTVKEDRDLYGVDIGDGCARAWAEQ